jgi:hypothetical protein
MNIMESIKWQVQYLLCNVLCTLYSVHSTLDSLQEEAQSLFAVVFFRPLPLCPSPIRWDRQILTQREERVREREKRQRATLTIITEVGGGGGGGHK